MEGYYTYPDSSLPAAPRKKRIAVVTQGVKLGDETRGYTRFRAIAEALVNAGFEVDLITSTFQHWDKAQRDTTLSCYTGLPYRVRFIYEPGYSKNLDVKRILSHRVFARNLRAFLLGRFADKPRAYDLVYSEIPPNDMALACAEVARNNGVPYVCDVNDLWPEAMRMVLDIPVVSDVLFSYFTVNAKAAYRCADGVVGSSDEYRDQPLKYGVKVPLAKTVYVGTDIARFDQGAAANASRVQKPEGEFWVTYAGTLGASYDIGTLIEAAFHTDSIDCLPVGDLAETMATLVLSNPDRPDFILTCTSPDGEMQFSTEEIRAALGGVSLAEPEVYQWMLASLREEIEPILGGIMK